MRIKLFISMAAVAMMAGLSALIVSGSSHNDAPLIAEDPTANNTDVYAFVSTEDGRSDYVTIIANYIPMEEPGNGPTHYRFSDKVLYEIMVDVDGDANEDITYQFEFENNVVNGLTFLYNTGKIGLPAGGSGPDEQYENLNVQQSYTLTEVVGKRRKGGSTVLLEDARVAPAHVGPLSTGTIEEYEALADAAIHTIGTAPYDMRVFVGPRDEGFYADLMAAFDLLGGITDPGFDTFSGFNVHTIALEIPKSRFADAGDTNDTIGVWASASRPKETVLRKKGVSPKVSEKMVQVSRLGNPLVNELLLPLEMKDLFNATKPKKDGINIADFITDPGTTQGGFAIVPLLNGLTGCTGLDDGRFDLELIFLTGIGGDVAAALADAVPSLAPFAAGNQVGPSPVTSEMIRLNYGVPPTASPSPLGLLGGDPAGYPNGRRVGDDVIDITLKAGTGAVLEVLAPGTCPASLTLTDNVPGDPSEYLDMFPYLGTPHQGYEHEHSHRP